MIVSSTAKNAGYVAKYFGNDANADDSKSEACKDTLVGYICVLDSMATEESLVYIFLMLIINLINTRKVIGPVRKYNAQILLLQVNFARWEPAHGGFNFRHPWKDYLELGSLLRSSACCIDTLSGIVSDTKVVSRITSHSSSKRLQ